MLGHGFRLGGRGAFRRVCLGQRRGKSRLRGAHRRSRRLAGGGEEYGKTVPPEGEFTSVSAGEDYSCGVRTDGSIECWGGSQTVIPAR